MSREILSMVKNMNVKAVEIQLILQCAPFISGLKKSNLLLVNKEKLYKLKKLLDGSLISYSVLYENSNKIALLLYNEQEMNKYLNNESVKTFLLDMGYENISFKNILKIFKLRYEKYMQGNEEFPHEMGILLGYPIEDVKGFVENKGKNSLYTGYWKVYDRVEEKEKLFEKFKQVEETMIKLIYYGITMEEILDIYSEDRKC